MELQPAIVGTGLTLTVSEPSSGLAPADLERIGRELSRANQDPAHTGLILHLRGGHSVAPALAEPLGDLCSQIEASAKPVIACLSGQVGGAVWALALAARVRIGAPDVQAVMPELRFGLMAGAGITQRLPRLIGAGETLRMMLGTRPEPGAALLALGALDRIAAGDLNEAALEVLKAGLPPRRTPAACPGFRNPKRYLEEVKAFQARVSEDPLDAARAAIRAVEVALLLPLPAGLAFEAVSLEDLVAAPQTRAVRHALSIERAAREGLRQLVDSVRRLPGGRTERLGLWRAGPERAELVVSALKKGLSVRLADPSGAGLVEILNRVAALQGAMVTQNLISPEARDADWARLETGQRAGILSGCDMVLAAQGDVPMAEIGAGASGVSLGHWSGVTAGWARLLPPKGFGEHAELGEPRDPAARAGLPLLLDFGRRMGWRFQVSGGEGFVSPALLACQPVLTARLSAMGYKGAVLTAGLASVGIGGMRLAPRARPAAEVQEVGQLALAALANEGARLIEEGIARSASEVDYAALAAGVLPRWMGGPMYQADLRGLILLRSDLRRLDGPGRVAPCGLLDRMITEGARFYP